MILTWCNRLLLKILYIVRRDDLGKICWNILVTLFICFEKFEFISNVKPILNLKNKFKKRWKNIALLNLKSQFIKSQFELPDGSHLISDI